VFPVSASSFESDTSRIRSRTDNDSIDIAKVHHVTKVKENLNTHNSSHGTVNTKKAIKNIPNLFLYISVKNIITTYYNV
jgi:hypothetical protein